MKCISPLPGVKKDFLRQRACLNLIGQNDERSVARDDAMKTCRWQKK